MRIKRTLFSISFLFFTALFAVPHGTKAVTVEVEEDEADVDAPPTPLVSKSKPETSKPQAAAAKTEMVKNEKGDVAATPVPKNTESKMARVRISDKIGFHYFVKSGFAVLEGFKVPAVGHIAGAYDNQISYSTPKQTVVELSSSKFNVKVGDLLVAFNKKGQIF